MAGESDSAKPFVFIGGVEVSRACLETLCEAGFVPRLTIGYDESRADASGFTDFGPLADRFGFELVRTGDVNDPELVDRIEALEPALSYVIGWSQLIRPRLLAVPRHGSVGIHPTRLPEGRGRAPIPWTILKGMTSTASTMFFLTEGVDDGDVIGRVEIEVDAREDAGTLYAKHLAAHRKLVREHTRELLAGAVSATPQDHAKATIWPRRRPEDGEIDWTRDAEEVDRLVRAVTRPFPGAYGELPAGKLTVWRSEIGPDLDEPPGTPVERDGAVFVACGRGSLRIVEADGLPG